MLPESTRDALPVFPLPDVVLMPGEALPLHIFEPRYQRLLEAVMAGDRLMGMGTLVPGSTDIHEEIGVGRVMRHEPLADGRSNIVLMHVATVRAESECEQVEPFRRFRTVEMPNEEPVPVELDAARSLLYQLAAGTKGLDDDALKITQLSGLELVHAVARRLYRDPDDRRVYLASTDAERVRAVCSELAALLAGRPAVADA
ncbi:MAG: LON peptidase substrate-binding domain-containing protein [Alphaproteobacteria bacterium]|nr:LON peptidase substrate-binding domain-containing protein [Alphaproteobacteria bacterium]